MNENNPSVNVIKAFVALVLVSVIALASFGVGFTLGRRSATTAAAPVVVASLAAPALSPTTMPGASAAEVVALPSPTGGAPTGGASAAEAPRPSATPQPPVAAPTRAPTATPARPRPSSDTTAAGDVLDEALFMEVWKLLNKQFYGDLPQGKEITYDAIRGVVDRLGDQHTAFVDPKAAELFNSDLQGSFEGIGAQVELAEGGGVRLRYLFPNQPAEKSGLQAGDVILAVDGKDITKLTLLEAIGLIRGPKNSQVKLSIRRGTDKPFDITVTRDRIEIPVVEAKTLADGKIEYVSLAEFSSVAPGRLSEALNKALAKKPAGLILDLRGDPGGLLDAAVRIGSYFVPKGPILLERTKDGSVKTYDRQGRYLLGDTPLVVLVDGGSASASEIVAGAIQDAGTGILIGEKTYGKGSVQLPNNLSDGSQLRVTIARWFTPKDRGIHGTGLEPDIKVPMTKEDVAAKRDPQLDRAVQYLTEKSAK